MHLSFRGPATLRGRVALLAWRLRRWLTYRPERRYMRGGRAPA